ncbi:MAG: hypothetical protein ABIT37_01640 [Luteolibacter sp.]
MPATLVTLLGSTGQHGIAADETGMLISKLDDVSKCRSNPQLNRVGNQVGSADFNETIEIDIEGEITATTPWAQKISAELTLTNTVDLTHIQQTTAGKTYIQEVKRSRGRDKWVDINVKAVLWPNYA